MNEQDGKIACLLHVNIHYSRALQWRDRGVHMCQFVPSYASLPLSPTVISWSDARLAVSCRIVPRLIFSCYTVCCLG